jgi:hypothetical protein
VVPDRQGPRSLVLRRQRVARHLAGFGVFAALVLTAPGEAALERAGSAQSSPRVRCDVPGDWPRTADARWLWTRLQRAGYSEIGCTGSAFVVDYGGPGLYGHDLSIWAFTAPRLTPESPLYRIIAGVRVYGEKVRLAWRTGRRNVWVGQGPTARRLPPLRVLRRLVRATTR